MGCKKVDDESLGRSVGENTLRAVIIWVYCLLRVPPLLIRGRNYNLTHQLEAAGRTHRLVNTVDRAVEYLIGEPCVFPYVCYSHRMLYRTSPPKLHAMHLPHAKVACVLKRRTYTSAQ